VTYYGWKRVGVILEDEDLFTKTFFDLRELLTNAGVDVRSFKLHHSELDTDKEEVFEFNNFEGIRIFVILSYESFAVPMLCEAYKRGLWYPQYLFLLNGWYSDGFWKADNDMSDCTAGEIEQALQHTLTVDILPNARVLGDDWSADDLDITNGEFYEAEKAHISTPSPPLNLTITNFLSQYCYDATWAFALVLNQTISDLESNDSLNKLARILALLLSFATWKVQMRGLYDSKPIIIATYVTSLVLAVVIVSTYSLVEYINGYATVFGTTFILCLVFMTKMYVLVKDPEGKKVFMTKSGDVRSGSSHPGSQGEDTLKRINTDLDAKEQ
jgi:hypothetical protein